MSREVAALAAQGERLETRGPEGPTVWHRWGGGGQPLVLLHGGWGSWTHWFRAIPALAREYTVLAADIPGLGDSARPPEPHTAEGLAAILADGVKELLGDDDFHMSGFSFGGMIGSHVAKTLGTQCRTFTFVGAAGFGTHHTPPKGTRLPKPEMTEDEIDELQRRNLELLMFHDPAKIDDLAVHIHRENLARGRVRSRPISMTDATMHALPHIKARLAGIWGEHDNTLSKDGGLAARRDVIRTYDPKAPFHIIEGIGHWVMYEGSDVFADTLIETLRTLAPD